MVLPGLSTSSVLVWGPRTVGFVFLCTAVIKAVAPRNFSRHIARLGVIPRKHETLAVTGLAAMEAGWGTALIVGLASPLLSPLSILLLAGFSAISWWGVRTGKTEDCGCYGGFIEPSIGQSLGLNGLFALLIALPWLAAPESFTLQLWKVVLAGVVVAATATMAHMTQRFEAKHHRPFFDTNPLKVGRQWRHSWSGGATAGLTGDFIVSMLGTECPYCKQWVRVANAIDQSPTLPSVVGVVAAKGDKLVSFKEQHGVRFPVGTVSDSLMNRMVEVVPTTVLIESGEIKEIWSGSAPPEFAKRFISAFFPTLPERESAPTLSDAETRRTVESVPTERSGSISAGDAIR